MARVTILLMAWPVVKRTISTQLLGILHEKLPMNFTLLELFHRNKKVTERLFQTYKVENVNIKLMAKKYQRFLRL